MFIFLNDEIIVEANEIACVEKVGYYYGDITLKNGKEIRFAGRGKTDSAKEENFQSMWNTLVETLKNIENRG
jgi:hypothetical protein